ncbi:MAG: aspartate-semialdehyde dehydrogenase [Oscillospiraceae bacterium]|nr:aspartate-semialdehyde dehydrogenase [Oscillospiraceae bacterium]
MSKLKAGILGATGMVGQRFVQLLLKHPWFEISVLAASKRSAGKTFEDAIEGKKFLKNEAVPESVWQKKILDIERDAKKIVSQCDFVFCAVEMPKEGIKNLEDYYAKLECPVISNNSAHRFTSDVPMVIPEINPEHIKVIEFQKKRLGTKRGFVAVKPNCSLQCFLPALHPLKEFGIESLVVCTYQSISGAGKTMSSFPQIIDNVIPFIKAEEEKTELEPLKIWGKILQGKIVSSDLPKISAQCSRVPVSDGHMAVVFANFSKEIPLEEVIYRWDNFNYERLPSSPKKLIMYLSEEDRPQTNLDRDRDSGMGVTVGRLRRDSQFCIKFVCVSHNTLRGAAGGSVLLAELLTKYGFL